MDKMNRDEETRRFFLDKSIQIRKQIITHLSANPELDKLVEDLKSIGISLVIDVEVGVQLVARDNFVIPKDLSALTESALDSLFSPDDWKFLQSLSMHKPEDIKEL